MRLPSLDRLGRGAAASLRRFPAVLAAAAVATAAGIALVEDPGEETWARVLAAGTLGLPLSFAFTMLAERRDWVGARRAGLFGLGLTVLAGVYLAWPTWTDPVAGRRYVQLAVGFHLLAVLLPYLGVREPRGFWQYNRTLFLRFLTAALYAAVLYAGLALALASLDHLFGVHVAGETYMELWVVLAFLFHPWFFIGGLPDELASLDERTDYPRGLEVFTQYVLVPLVLVYLVILTVYAGKVLVTWDWPSGWIGWLVSGVAVAGILAALLVHPVRDEADHAWVRVYGRWFWPAVLPAVALLMIAVAKRIAQYGITENRYFLAVLTLWLAGTAVTYTVRRFERLKAIPASLCVIAFVTFLGPWSAYAISERSQRGRLEGLLERHQLVVDGTVRPAEAAVPFEDRKEISATVRYLLQVHGPGAAAPAFGGELPVPDTGSTSAQAVVQGLGLEYVNRWEGRAAGRHFTLRAQPSERPSGLEGYRAAVRSLRSHRSEPLSLDDPPVEVRADTSGVRLEAGDGTSLEISVGDAARRLLAEGRDSRHTVPAEAMWVEAEAAGLRAGLWLESVSGRRASGEGLEVTRWEGDLYLGW